MNSKSLNVIQAVCDGPGVKTRYMIRQTLSNEYTNLRRTLATLEEHGAVEQVSTIGCPAWVLTNTGQEITTESTSIFSETETFSVRLTHNDAELLIQPGLNGYQLTTWWKTSDGTRKSADTWIRYNPDQSMVKMPDGMNQHPRSGIILKPFSDDSSDVIARVIDPDPRHDTFTNGIASLAITYTESGFDVELDVFSSEWNTPETSTATVPFIDPRDDREAFYATTQ